MNSDFHFAREAFSSPDLRFSWGKTNANHADLRNIFNTFELKSMFDFSNYFNLEEEYKEVESKISKIIRSFKAFGHPFKVSEVVPKLIMEDYVSIRDQILIEACEKVEEECPKELVDFYTSSFFNLPKKLNKTIITSNGEEELNFVFSKNFRFKSKDGLNIFNMPKKERFQIIPQGDDHLLYSCDIRQFEFRTFLDVHPSLEIPNSDNLYEYFAKKLQMTEETCKISIISYLYGSTNKHLDDFFNRSEILTDEDYLKYQDFYVYLDHSQQENKVFHTIIQSISQFRLLRKIENLLNLLKDFDSLFLFPLHDELVFSLNKTEAKTLIPKIREIIVDETYKIHEYLGLNYYEMRKI